MENIFYQILPKDISKVIFELVRGIILQRALVVMSSDPSLVYAPTKTEAVVLCLQKRWQSLAPFPLLLLESRLPIHWLTAASFLFLF